MQYNILHSAHTLSLSPRDGAVLSDVIRDFASRAVPCRAVRPLILRVTVLTETNLLAIIPRPSPLLLRRDPLVPRRSFVRSPRTLASASNRDPSIRLRPTHCAILLLYSSIHISLFSYCAVLVYCTLH